ncbi:MAG: PaaX domain-containing protein, C- domain protein [Desertimonas sp.]
MTEAAGALDELGMRPLNARSLVLSILLGQVRPSMSSGALARLGPVFGIQAGTMRTALSRMVAAGELASEDGEYRLAGRLLERKAAQDIGRRSAPAAWDGTWWTALVTAPRRDIADRRAFRTTMANLRMGELRPDTWLRPANLPGPDGDDDLAVVRGPIRGVSDTAMVGFLWSLDALAGTARRLLAVLDRRQPELTSGRPESLAMSIGPSAAVVRFLRAEPLLPAPLVPDPWPVEQLRERYRDFDIAFAHTMQAAVHAAT